jgi:hypothetical protein
MLLQEVFDQLACAELNNISVVDQSTKQINPEDYRKVATAINAGLTALHTRFLLRKGELTVKLQPGATWYKLVKRNPAVVADTDFRDNLLKVQQVFTNCGRELSMNNHTDCWSVSESSYDTIKVPLDLQDKHNVTELRVVYRQDHKMIPTMCDDIEPDCYGLTLPRSHLWALCLFVASRMHIPIGLQDATYSGNSFMALYNAECDRLQTTGLEVVDIGVNYGVVRKGFP